MRARAVEWAVRGSTVPVAPWSRCHANGPGALLQGVALKVVARAWGTAETEQSHSVPHMPHIIRTSHAWHEWSPSHKAEAYGPEHVV